jgi:putative inorganic carbon (HCO3(-)) transporter
MLIFVIPINYATHFFRRPYEFGAGGLPFSPMDIILIVLYTIWLYELLIKKSGQFRFFPSITIPILCLIGFCALSMIPAQDPYLALFEAVIIFKAFLLYIYLVNHIRNKRDISFIVVLLLVGLSLQSILAFLQRWLGVSLGLQLFGERAELLTFTLDYYLKTSRVGGTIGHPNGLAKYVELLAPLALAFLFSGIKLRLKVANCLIFACSIVVLLLTLSRGGWVCFAGSMVLFFMLIFRANLISVKNLVAIALMIVIFLGIGLSFSGLIQSRLFGDDYGAAQGRIPLNKWAINVIKAHPILGVGVRNYGKVMHLYNPNLEAHKANRVHNIYLLMAAEMGIPGLLVFLWFLYAIFRQGFRNLKGKDVFLVCLNIGILVGMATLLAHWLVDPGYIGRVGNFWVLTGLIAASGKMYGEEGLLQAEGAITDR